MARAKSTGRATSVGSIHHVEVLTGRRIRCHHCGKSEALAAYARDLAGIRSFNQQVYEWAEAHRACTSKEG